MILGSKVQQNRGCPTRQILARIPRQPQHNKNLLDHDDTSANSLKHDITSIPLTTTTTTSGYVRNKNRISYLPHCNGTVIANNLIDIDGIVSIPAVQSSMSVRGATRLGSSLYDNIKFRGILTQTTMAFDGSLHDEFATILETTSGIDLNFTGQSKTVSIPDASGTILSTGNLKYIDGQNATAIKIPETLKSLRHAEFGTSGKKTTILGTSIFDGEVSFGHSNFNDNINLKGTLIASTLIFGKTNNSGSYHP